MKLVTRQTLANELAGYLAARYSYLNGTYRQWLQFHDHYEKAYNKLIALGDNPDVAIVESIMGGNSWTTVRCDSCRNIVGAAVLVATTDNYDEVHLCLDCLKLASEIAETAR